MNSDFDTLTIHLAQMQSFGYFDDSYTLIKGNYRQLNYTGSLLETDHQDITVNHQQKFLNMSTSACPIKTMLPPN